MKKITTILVFLVFISCQAQYTPELKDLSQNYEVNYILANIWQEATYKELYNGSLYVKTFIMGDSKATPEGLFEGYDAIISSLLISVVPDGDYYTSSKLYKIERLIRPKILEIKEAAYPNFSIKIEHGFYDKRKIEVFAFEGVH